ncbi:enoyl-CoA hydratase/isomerase family protein [Rhizobium sp. C4]|uniref:enoyl-CoA hydratase/isomerase family protein n=1 Tax=Rhizobium sp. C4 TaxID=1349800 RepID=UPI001E3C0925|nr:enoyl-CoA hydratase/isomerase family protein [Rhizobium sp. C4]MCD2172249.1 enoyl-CoA hydratase/isomerase family protein [Rhizobium sp. C4]
MSEDTDAPVRIEFKGPIAIVTMDNAKTKNALSPEMIRDLGDRFEQLMGDWNCRAIVLTGANGAFCSGGDVSRMQRDRQVLDTRTYIGGAHRILRAMVNGAKPVIAAVEGAAIGAGMSLVAACDYAVASQRSKFCAAFAKVGLAPDSGLYWTLPQRVGLGRAKKLIMLANTFAAAEAERIGLVDEAVDDGTALTRAIVVAEEFAAAAPLSIAVTKAVYADGVLTLDDAFRAERDHHPMLVRSADHLNAIDAFREKRQPKFEGK